MSLLLENKSSLFFTSLPWSDTFPGSHCHTGATGATAGSIGAKLSPVVVSRPCQLKNKTVKFCTLSRWNTQCAHTLYHSTPQTMKTDTKIEAGTFNQLLYVATRVCKLLYDILTACAADTCQKVHMGSFILRLFFKCTGKCHKIVDSQRRQRQPATVGEPGLAGCS